MHAIMHKPKNQSRLNAVLKELEVEKVALNQHQNAHNKGRQITTQKKVMQEMPPINGRSLREDGELNNDFIESYTESTGEGNDDSLQQPNFVILNASPIPILLT